MLDSFAKRVTTTIIIVLDKEENKFSSLFGHFGCIQLPYPVLNPMFLSLLVAVLQVHCINCHRLRLSPFYVNFLFPPGSNNTGLRQLRRLKAIAALCSRQNFCAFCKAPTLSFKQQGLAITAKLHNKLGSHIIFFLMKRSCQQMLLYHQLLFLFLWFKCHMKIWSVWDFE